MIMPSLKDMNSIGIDKLSQSLCQISCCTLVQTRNVHWMAYSHDTAFTARRQLQSILLGFSYPTNKLFTSQWYPGEKTHTPHLVQSIHLPTMQRHHFRPLKTNWE